jgi:small subunit ribosomal protein S17
MSSFLSFLRIGRKASVSFASVSQEVPQATQVRLRHYEKTLLEFSPNLTREETLRYYHYGKTQETKVTRKTTLKGQVVSTKMKDTVVVLVNRYVKHPKYKKYMKIGKRIKAHDEGNATVLGDTVFIEECSPIFKRKKISCCS